MAGVKITVNVAVTFEHLAGPDQDAETLLDAFAARVGRQNTAENPVRIVLDNWSDQGEELEQTVYEVALIDDVVRP